jgi:hypothetical protein
VSEFRTKGDRSALWQVGATEERPPEGVHRMDEVGHFGNLRYTVFGETEEMGSVMDSNFKQNMSTARGKIFNGSVGRELEGRLSGILYVIRCHVFFRN